MSPLTESDQESRFNPYLRYLTINNLLITIAILTIVNVILFFAILGVFVTSNSNEICTAQSEIHPLAAQPMTKVSIPAFTHETIWNGYSYRYYIGDDLVNWSSALNKCRDQGFGTLFIESVDEIEFLHEWISTKENLDSGLPVGTKYRTIWTSGYRDHNITHWLWETTGETVLHQLWSPGAPNSSVNQRCISLFLVHSESVLFGDAQCNSLGRYICKRKS